MIRRITTLMLALCLTMVLSTQALAAAGDKYTYGVSDISVNSGYTLTLQESDGTVATRYSAVDGESTKSVYDAVEKMELSFAGSSENQYMVFLMQGSEVPTESSLRYIDQVTGSANTSFTIYPSTLKSAGTYYIYVSSTQDGYEQVGSFQVLSSWTEAAFTLGDVNEDGFIDVNDAVTALQASVGQISLTAGQEGAANVLNPTTTSVDVNDAVRILQYAVKQISEF